MSAIDGLLLLGFGGPTPGCCKRRPECPQTPGCEAECFVAGILGDNPARLKRVHEVADHYRITGGGFSPYIPLTQRQADSLSAELRRRGQALPVVCGYRHWTPWAIDGLRQLRDQGCRSIGLLILAPHQSSVSWDWYLTHAAEAVDKLTTEGGAPIAIGGIAAPWWERPGHITAIADQIRNATSGWSAERFANAALIFTAHAIPQPVEVASPYRQQFAENARRVADLLGHRRHAIAFQSAPSDSRVPWSAPTIEAALDTAKAAGATDAIVQAAGFLVDHTEVLYDLDHEAKAHAAAIGIGFTRATCVHEHPAFIGTLADAVQAI